MVSTTIPVPCAAPSLPSMRRTVARRSLEQTAKWVLRDAGKDGECDERDCDFCAAEMLARAVLEAAKRSRQPWPVSVDERAMWDAMKRSARKP